MRSSINVWGNVAPARIRGANSRRARRKTDLGQISSLPYPRQVGNLPHAANSLRRTIAFFAASILSGVLFAVAGCGSQDTAKHDAPAASIPGTPAGTAEREHPDRPKTAPRSDPDHPMVVIETSMGSITIILDKEHAPLSVDHFLSYVIRNQYNDTIFHQFRLCGPWSDGNRRVRKHGRLDLERRGRDRRGLHRCRHAA